jgi:hypothetical protein
MAFHDWRQTIGDLYAEAYYGTIARRPRARHDALRRGVEDHRPQLGDDMTMRARADAHGGNVDHRARRRSPADLSRRSEGRGIGRQCLWAQRGGSGPCPLSAILGAAPPI